MITEDGMVGWHPGLDGDEFEQALGVGDGQGTLVLPSMWPLIVGHDRVTELTDLYVVHLVKNQLETEIVIKKKPVFFHCLFLFLPRYAATSLNLADVSFLYLFKNFLSLLLAASNLSFSIWNLPEALGVVCRLCSLR